MDEKSSDGKSAYTVTYFPSSKLAIYRPEKYSESSGGDSAGLSYSSD